MCLGPQWRFFSSWIRLNTNILIIYTSTNITEKPQQTNWMPAIYAVSWDCQMFQVNFIPSPVSTFWRRNVPNWKTAIWFFPISICLKWSFLSHSVKTIDGLPCCSHQATTSLLKPAICTLWETPEKTWRQSFPLIVAAKCCGRFITTGKSVLYFISSKKLKRKWPIGEQLWTLFELIWLRIKVTCIVCLTIVAWNILLPASDQL